MDSNPPAPSPPPALALAGFRARYRSPRRLAKVVTAMFALYVGSIAMEALLRWDFLDLAHAERAGYSISQEVLNDLVAREAKFLWIGFLLSTLSGVTFLMWTYRVARNVVDTDGSLSFSPGWAVGYYFIPIVSLWRPYNTLAEVWDASDPDRGAEGPRCASHGLLLGWWLTWILSIVAINAVTFWIGLTTPDAWVTQIHVGLISDALTVVSAGLALAVVWQLTHRQDLRATPPVPVARIA